MMVQVDPRMPYVPEMIIKFVTYVLAPYVYKQLKKVRMGMSQCNFVLVPESAAYTRCHLLPTSLHGALTGATGKIQ